MIFIYRLLTILFYPIFIILIYFRKLLNKEDYYRYKEKIFPSNFSPDKNNNKQLIWFHAASIGEVQSIFPLIRKLDDDKKNLEFLITTVTLSGGNILITFSAALIVSKLLSSNFLINLFWSL